MLSGATTLTGLRQPSHVVTDAPAVRPTAEGPPSSFDRLRMRATGAGEAGGVTAPGSFTLSLPKGEVSAPVDAADTAKRAKIAETAQAFEGQLLSLMMQPMFAGLSVEPPFGGGAGEGAWRGVLLDEMGKAMARAGGVGLADPVRREMLRMQGLSE
jgi:peptidoglycan hydrolase FlgJ